MFEVGDYVEFVDGRLFENGNRWGVVTIVSWSRLGVRGQEFGIPKTLLQHWMPRPGEKVARRNGQPFSEGHYTATAGQRGPRESIWWEGGDMPIPVKSLKPCEEKPAPTTETINGTEYQRQEIPGYGECLVPVKRLVSQYAGAVFRCKKYGLCVLIRASMDDVAHDAYTLVYLNGKVVSGLKFRGKEPAEKHFLRVMESGSFSFVADSIEEAAEKGLI